MEHRPLVRPLRFLGALLGLSLLGGIGPVEGAVGPENPLVTVGLPLTGNADGAYLHLESQRGSDFTGSVFQVFRKAGAADSGSDYEYRGQVRAYTDSRTIESLLSRGLRLTGASRPAIEEAVDSLLQAVETAGEASYAGLAEKIAVLNDNAAGDPDLADSLRLLSRRFPPVAAATGYGFLEETAAATYTYEIREADGPLAAPAAADRVVGRVTVDTSTPLVLPAPTTLSAIPMSDARGDAVLRLRWAVPTALRQQTPFLLGYRLYRVPAGTFASAPTVAQLAPHAVNALPVLPGEQLTAAAADPGQSPYDVDAALQTRFGYPVGWETATENALSADPSLAFPANAAQRATARALRLASQAELEAQQEVYFLTDDGGLSAGGPGLTRGASLDYYVAAVDLLGNSGTPSAKLTVTVPDFRSPPAPDNLEVTNRYEFTNLSTRSQDLELTWDPVTDEAGNIRTDLVYYVYRWNAPTESQRYEAYPFGHGFTEASPSNLGDSAALAVPIGVAAGPGDLAAPAPGEPYRWVDPEVGTNEQSLAFHYTVRAVADNGTGFPVLSPMSEPVRGVLRDREGPAAAPTLTLSIPCQEDPTLNCGQTSRKEGGSRNDGSFLLRLRVETTDQGQLARARFAAVGGGQRIELGTVPFEADGSKDLASLDRVFPAATFSAPPEIAVTVFYANGQASPETLCPLGDEPVHTVTKTLTATAGSTAYASTATGSCGEVYFPENSAGAFEAPEISGTPAADTYSYLITRRVDGGAPELLDIVEDSGADGSYAVLAAIAALLDEDLPAQANEVCYFYQGFDQHANPGPVQRIGCLTFGADRIPLPPVDVVDAVRASGSTAGGAVLDLSLFTPAEGVERLELLVRAEDGLPVDGLSDGAGDGRLTARGTETLTSDQLPPEFARFAGTYAVYRTARLAELETDADGNYLLPVGGVEAGVAHDFVARALGEGYRAASGRFVSPRGAPGAPLTAAWQTAVAGASGSGVPEVPWPARALEEALDLGAAPVVASGSIRPAWVESKHGTGGFLFRGVGVEIGELVLSLSALQTEALQFSGKDRGDTATAEIVIVQFGDTTAAGAWADGLYEIAGLTDAGGNPRTALPGVLYRMMVDGAGQPVTRNLTQCSPLVEETSLAAEVNGTQLSLYDPFLHIGEGVAVAGGGGDQRYPLYLVDTQPVIAGDTYRYFLALFRVDGEVAAVLDLGTLTIPLP